MISERAVRITTDYARERKAFGTTLLEMQNTRFKLAEAKTIAHVGRVFIDSCIERYMAGTLDTATASMAKWWTTDMQQQVLDESDALIAELREAGTIVIGLPMYNFGIPSQLKAYFDHVARAGVTFRYTDKGAVGLLTGKKAYVFAARGGLYQGTPRDTQTAYVRDFLAFLGITDVEFVYAEGLAISEASKAESLASAQHVLRNLAQPERIAA